MANHLSTCHHEYCPLGDTLPPSEESQFEASHSSNSTLKMNKTSCCVVASGDTSLPLMIQEFQKREQQLENHMNNRIRMIHRICEEEKEALKKYYESLLAKSEETVSQLERKLLLLQGDKKQ